MNPSPETIRLAQLPHRMAADLRAASQALREAESRACAGSSGQVRDESPFAHHAEIEAVEPLSARSPASRSIGAAVLLLAVLKGVTASVLSTGRGFSVEIRSGEVDAARELLRRAEALLSRS